MHIPGYQIHEEIGRGGMSTVYRAVQESLQREVALKVLSPELSKDKEYCEQLINEGKIIAQLAHPNIVTIYDMGVHDERYYLSMEYVADGSLRDLLDQSPILQSEAFRIFKELAETLAYAHQQGVIHMDIKPRNILVRPNGNLVLTDFGIAKSIAAESEVGTNTEELEKRNFFHASPKYMSPEQIRGKFLDKRTDIYSLGIILHEMLMHKVPYAAEDAMGIARMHLSEPVPTLPDHLQHYQQLLSRLLAKDSQHRLPDMERVLETLDWINGKRPDDVGGDTDRLSRVELLSELDHDEEVMNIELADDGETTVAISSAFAALDVHSVIEEEELEAEMDRQFMPARNGNHTIPTDISYDGEVEGSHSEAMLNIPDMSDVAIDSESRATNSNVWKRVFVPAAAAMMVGYFLVVQFVLSPDDAAITVPVSSAPQPDSQTVESEELIVAGTSVQDSEPEILNEIVTVATRYELLNDEIEQKLNAGDFRNALNTQPETDEPKTAQQELFDNATKILALANEKVRLQEEIAELERLAALSQSPVPAGETVALIPNEGSAPVEQSVVSVPASLSTPLPEVAADSKGEIDKIEDIVKPTIKPEPAASQRVALATIEEKKQPAVAAQKDIEKPIPPVVATVPQSNVRPQAEQEEVLVASAEFEPLNGLGEGLNEQYPQYETISVASDTSEYYGELQRELRQNQPGSSTLSIAIIDEGISSPSDLFEDSRSDGSDGLEDLGVVKEGESLVIDRTLEQRLREYAAKVDRLDDGRLRVVLDQQDLYLPDSHELDVAARMLLDRLSFVFRNYSGFSINVIDRTTQNGSLTTRNLSWSRAKSASSYLIAQGMDQPRIQHRGNSVNGGAGRARGLELILAPMI